MKSPKVSIIVPVYKVEKYLEKCLDSILSQTFNDFECILVDDNSPDKCPDICDEYAKKDRRIKVIHKKENEGLPQARKTGFHESIGYYILFLDSDDWIEQKMLERLYTLAIVEKHDIVYCDFDEFSDSQENGKRAIRWNFDTRKMEKTDILINLLKFNMAWSIWNKLFKRELFENIIFPKYQQGEDAVLCIQLFLKAENIGYEYSILYHYRKNPDSLSLKSDRENKKRRKEETYNNFSDIQKILSRRGDYNKYKDVMNWRMKHLTYHESFLWRLLKYIIPYGILKTYRKWKNK